MRQQWIVQRTVRAESDGQRRWDRAYQHLLAWANPEPRNEHNTIPCPPPDQEKNHESSNIRPSVHPAPGTDTDQ